MTTPSRPAVPPPAAILDNHRPLIRSIERRLLLRRGLSLGTLVALTGCAPENEASVQAALLAMSRWNDRVQAWLFDPNKLAPTYPASAVLKPPRFNAYFGIGDLRPVNPATWRLDVAGAVTDRTPWTLDRLAALPQSEIIVRHICVEGWDYIGQWSGVPLRAFLARVGADLRAPYVGFRTADDYGGTIDMATALHPQTLLATTYAGQTVTDPFGFPVRLRTSTKL